MCIMKKSFSLLVSVLCTVFLFLFVQQSCFASVVITKSAGWYESAYAEWSVVDGASSYHVYYQPQDGATWTQLDQPLVRNYISYGRADIVGLAAGNYRLKVVPVVAGAEDEGQAAVTDLLAVETYDRSGFAHQGRTEGVGAYNNDGTLKANAKIIYLWANNAKTVSASILYDKAEKTFTGIQAICKALEKGTETAPVCIRIIGTVKNTDTDELISNEGLQIKGKNNTTPMNITVEGIGNDAAIWGFGILVRNVCSAEFRNFASYLCMDDCLSLDTNNRNIWIHNMDFFYGNTGSDSDQAKGDGTVDVKGKSTMITISYNHFWDCGKTSLGGMKSETTDCCLSYHHNWFDHSDSRHPRIRTMSFHIYNNYFDGVSKYGVGMTMGGSALVENNYFRNCKYPLLTSLQGTDAQGSGTFSGETGGVIKSVGNVMVNPKQCLAINAATAQSIIDQGEWDAYEAATAAETVPANVVCFSGNTAYNNFDTNGTLAYTYQADEAENVPDIVMAAAGRLEKGDFQWQFNNALQDENYGVIEELKNELINYKSALYDFFDGIQNLNYGEQTRSGGDKEKNPTYVPSWAGGGGESDDVAPFLVSPTTEGDYYYFNADNDAYTKAELIGNVVVLGTSSYSPTPDASDAEKYGINVVKSGGAVVFHCPTGITNFAFRGYRTGSWKGAVEVGSDGSTFSQYTTYEASKGTASKTFTLSKDSNGEYPAYLRLTNSATGALFVQGVKIYTPATASGIEELHNDGNPQPTTVKPYNHKTVQPYNLSGMRVSGNYKGIVITQGKKILR